MEIKLDNKIEPLHKYPLLNDKGDCYGEIFPSNKTIYEKVNEIIEFINKLEKV